jgi:hypothetical protein
VKGNLYAQRMPRQHGEGAARTAVGRVIHKNDDQVALVDPEAGSEDGLSAPQSPLTTSTL